MKNDASQLLIQYSSLSLSFKVVKGLKSVWSLHESWGLEID